MLHIVAVLALLASVVPASAWTLPAARPRAAIRLSVGSIPESLISASLIDVATGARVENLTERLNGKTVGLYFASSWCPACRNFLPSLKMWYDAVNSKEARGPGVELIFVSSGETKREYDLHLAAMGSTSYGTELAREAKGSWLAVPHEEMPTADFLKKEYGAWAGKEVLRLGIWGRKGGVPAMAVIDQKGGLSKYLNVESDGVKCLSEWAPSESPIWEG